MDIAASASRSNWARNLVFHATALHTPETREQVQQIVGRSPRLKVLGTGHCFNDIADTGGVQLSMAAFQSIRIDHQRATVTVGAGVTYGALAPVLDCAGFALENMASLPHITVAGAVATATHGSGVGNRCLAAAVVALEMVTADGGVLHLSREQDGAEFLPAVVSLGALGVVTSLTLALEPAFRVAQTVYTDMPFAHLRDFRDEVLGAGYSVSLFTDWQQRRATQVWIKDRVGDRPELHRPPVFFDAVRQTETLHPLPGHGAGNCTEQMGVPGPWFERLPHFRMEFTPSSGEELQTEYFVAMEDAWQAICAVEDLRDRITPLLWVTELRTVAADDLPLSMAFGRDSLAIHFTWRPMEAEVRALLPDVEAALAPFQPRPHWGKLFAMGADRIGAAYPQIGSFQALRRRLDPHGKFLNAWLERHLPAI